MPTWNEMHRIRKDLVDLVERMTQLRDQADHRDDWRSSFLLAVEPALGKLIEAHKILSLHDQGPTYGDRTPRMLPAVDFGHLIHARNRQRSSLPDHVARRPHP